MLHKRLVKRFHRVDVCILINDLCVVTGELSVRIFLQE